MILHLALNVRGMIGMKIKKMETNKIKIMFIVLLFSLILSMVSAITIYSGEPIEIELEKPYTYWSVVGNSTEVKLNITQNGNNVTIIPDKYSQEDSYEIVFFDSEKEIVIVNHYSGGGGGSRTKYKTEYVNKTKYVDVETIKEVPGEEVIVEKVTNKVPIAVWVLIGILLIALLYKLIFTNDTQVKGGNEYE